jgi:hypothetical protein
MLVLVCPPDVSYIVTPLFKHLSMLQIFFENMQHDCSPHGSWIGASNCSGLFQDINLPAQPQEKRSDLTLYWIYYS